MNAALSSVEESPPNTSANNAVPATTASGGICLVVDGSRSTTIGLNKFLVQLVMSPTYMDVMETTTFHSDDLLDPVVLLADGTEGSGLPKGRKRYWLRVSL